MPFINVKLIQGVFSADQTRDHPQLTDTMVSIEGEAMRGVTWVVVKEVAAGPTLVGRPRSSRRTTHRRSQRRLVPDGDG